MNISPLPDFVVIIIAMVVPAIAVLGILGNRLRSYEYWKDSLHVINGAREALSALREEGLLGLDLSIDALAHSVPDLLSPIAQALVWSVADAKGVVLNELNRARVQDSELLKQSISREMVSLISVMASRDITRAFERVGRMYLTTMLGGKDLPSYVDYHESLDQDVFRIMGSFSDALLQGDDRALSEELGAYLDTRRESDWAQMSPLAVLAVYWLRKELLSVNSDEWLPEKRSRPLLKSISATQEELLSLSVADITFAIAEGDREAVVGAIVNYYRRRRYPVLLARVLQKHYMKRAQSLRAM